MAGLVFPPEPNFDRENSHEFGTPTTNFDAIPIDPALGGPVIDPALMPEGMNGIMEQVHPELPFPPPPHFPTSHYHQNQQYNDGPQGDPFAPQVAPVFFPHEEELPRSPQKPHKRKRRPPREKECSFCQGNDKRNRDGMQEKMLTCTECGRSGHPSCMDSPNLIEELLNTYEWKCIECKNCEICREKGDDSEILFCDACDRGWHKFCLSPPVPETPAGRWHCPMCPQFPIHNEDFEMKSETLTPAPELIRDTSVASSSRSVASPAKAPKKKRRKPKVVAIPESDSEEVDVEATPKVAAVSARSRPGTGKRRGKAARQVIQNSEEEEDEEPPSLPKRSKAHPSLSLRIRMPPRSVKGKEKEEEEDPMKQIFKEMLGPEDRDTKETLIVDRDRRYFSQSDQLALNKQIAPPLATTATTEFSDMLSTPGPSRPTRAALAQQLALQSEIAASPTPSTPAPTTKHDPNSLRIRYIRFGAFDIKTWYDAPFPEEYSAIPDGRLWICEFCLKYMKSRFLAERHGLKCRVRHPPGDEIYRDGNISIFEIDGRKNKIYCQNLCLLSKMFLDHKSLFYDVEPFLFYVMTELDDTGARFVGYFSKEKRSLKDYNLSCIMTLPVRQRRGWGNLLMDFSYLLSKKEQRPGSPEKPLSDLGAVSYRNYWTLSVMRYLQNAPDHPRLEDISAGTGMTLEDIVFTLNHQRMLSTRERSPPPIKLAPGQTLRYPKGRKNGVARRHLQRTMTNDSSAPEVSNGPFVPPKHYEISFDREKVMEYVLAWEAKGYLQLRPERLQWSPYVLVRKDQEQAEAKEHLMAEKTVEEPVKILDPDGVTPMEGLETQQENQAPTPNGVVPTPLNLFTDDEAVEEAPTRRSRSPTKKKSHSEPQDPDAVMAELNGVDGLEESSRRRGGRSRPATRSTPKRPVKPKISTTELRSVTRSGRRTLSRANTDADEGWKTTADRTPKSRLRPRTGGTEENCSVSPPPSPSKPPVPRKRRRVGSISDGEEQAAPVTIIPSSNGINGDAVAASPVLMEQEVISADVPSVATVVREDDSPATKGDQEDEALFTGKESEDTMITSPPNTGEGKMAAEYDFDADADGEYDEDAEGEPDDEEELVVL